MHLLRTKVAPLFLCVMMGFGQAPTDKSPEIASRDAPSTFSSKVNLVMVPVVVRDAKGHAIGTLKKEDFQLFDKGKAQTIAKFAIEKADGRVVPLEVTSDDPVDPDNPEKKAAPGASTQASRFTAFLFDDMHTAFGDLAQARNAAAKYLAEGMQAADRVAVYTASGLNAIDFTDDREKLIAAMNRIQPRSRNVSTMASCPDVSAYQADLIQNKNDQMALNAAAAEALACGVAMTLPQAQSMAQNAASQVLSVADADTQISLTTLKAVVQRMASMPGQRTVVLVSSGFLVTRDRLYDETAVVDRAIRSNVTISTLDARGLWAIPPGGDASTTHSSIVAAQNKARYQQEAATMEGQVLGELADATGGTWFHNNNDLKEGFKRTGETPEFMYVLGFSPQNLKFDGSYHGLKVNINTKGLTVQARHGYYAPKHAEDPAETAKEEIRVALFSREELLDIPVDVQTQFFKSTDKTAKLSILAKVDLRHIHFKKSDGRNRNTISVVSAVFDRNGILVQALQKDIEMKFKDETFEARIAAGVAMKTSFDVPPGSYIVRLVVRDIDGQTMTARNRVVEIP